MNELQTIVLNSGFNKLAMSQEQATALATVGGGAAFGTGIGMFAGGLKPAFIEGANISRFKDLMAGRSGGMTKQIGRFYRSRAPAKIGVKGLASMRMSPWHNAPWSTSPVNFTGNTKQLGKNVSVMNKYLGGSQGALRHIGRSALKGGALGLGAYGLYRAGKHLMS